MYITSIKLTFRWVGPSIRSQVVLFGCFPSVFSHCNVYLHIFIAILWTIFISFINVSEKINEFNWTELNQTVIKCIICKRKYNWIENYWPPNCKFSRNIDPEWILLCPLANTCTWYLSPGAAPRLALTIEGGGGYKPGTAPVFPLVIMNFKNIIQNNYYIYCSRGASPVTVKSEDTKSPMKRAASSDEINVDDISPEEVKERRRLLAAQGSLKLRLSCKCYDGMNCSAPSIRPTFYIRFGFKIWCMV